MSETTPPAPVALQVPPTVPTPETGFLNLGLYPHPTRSLEVNSRYLVLDGRPWMPVMGEFHYSRYPENEWAGELAKIKAGGVDVVASYVIWNHHEAVQGRWRWDGQRDLARFIDLAAEAGLFVYLRPGPWVHAEVRLGGFPDWLAATCEPRSNDPAYLAHVRRLYGEIAAQARGRLWCDGGPVIGLQLENEYGGTGPGRGAEHIAALKQLAIDVGLTVPIYTVTGWPTLDIPPREVLPVSGAYADGFWQGSREALPPSGVFLFNTRRVIGEMGNVDGTPAAGLIDTAHYPFCLAEAGGGMAQSYHRRPVVGADDVHATTLVQLGSGANLYGYYMYHGGTNPVCETGPLNETQATGYPNDVPQWGYDFQAPLGQYGQVRPSWGRLRALHQLMRDFGATLAPCEAVLPVDGPFDPADRALPRIALRAAGASVAEVEGFVFVNHHVRHHPLPARRDLAIELRTADGGALRLPSEGGVALRPGAAFIWPVGHRLGAARLRQATVQPMARWTGADGDVVWTGFSLEGIAAELVFDAQGLATIEVRGGHVERRGEVWVVRLDSREGPRLVSVRDTAGRMHRVLVLSEDAAAATAKVRIGGRERLMWSSHPATVGVGADGEFIGMDAGVEEAAWVRVFPAEGLGGGREELAVEWAVWSFAAGMSGAGGRWPSPSPSPAIGGEGMTEAASGNGNGNGNGGGGGGGDRDGGEARLAVALMQAAGEPPALRWGPHVPWRDGPVPLVPDETARAAEAHWAIVPSDGLPRGRVWLTLELVGDVARLEVDGFVVDDRFCDGSPWTIAIDRWRRADGAWPSITLAVLPIAADLPVFLEPEARALGAGAALRRATLGVERRLVIDLGVGER